MKDLINEKLCEIEARESVRVLYAVESGSRAWGFASPDSDYDVRFIYVHPESWYLELQTRPDFIEWQLDETLDINGWDLGKTLQNLYKSNSAVFEWLDSPVVYKETPELTQIRELSRDYFAYKPTMYHYYGLANKTWLEFLQGESVRYKKYLYALRPLLACKWIEEKGCPPPTAFDTLKAGAMPGELEAPMAELLARKAKMTDKETAPHIPELDAYISDRLVYYKALIPTIRDVSTPGWEPINRLFRSLIG